MGKRRPYRLFGMGLSDWARSWFIAAYGSPEAARAAALRHLQETVDRKRMLGWRHIFMEGPTGLEWSAGLDDHARIVEPSPREARITVVR